MNTVQLELGIPPDRGVRLRRAPRRKCTLGPKRGTINVVQRARQALAAEQVGMQCGDYQGELNSRTLRRFLKNNKGYALPGDSEDDQYKWRAVYARWLL